MIGIGRLVRDAVRVHMRSAREIARWYVPEDAERDAFDERFELTRKAVARKVRRLVRSVSEDEEP